MAPITALAEETLQLLFAHINSTKHLAQCRLVCKHFNAIAEKAIFNCPITINTENQAFSLLQHLARCQRKGIAYFHWGLEPPKELTTPQVFRHLLPIILTSKTVSLSGCVEGEEFYELMDEILLQLPEKPNLISLPYPVVFDEDYYRFLIMYGSALQSVRIHLMDADCFDTTYINHVLVIPTLKSLVIKGELFEMEDIMYLLGNQLEEMDMSFNAVERDWDSRETAQIWIRSRNVNPSDNMKKLTLKGDCPAQQIEAFMFMYPKLESVSIDMRFPVSQSYGDLKAQMDRILDCLGEVAQKELIITSVNDHLLKETVAYLKSKGLDINIAAVESQFDIRMIVDGLN